MKNSVRFVVAGLMLAGFATAQAQSLPSSGSSDLWLFVSDQAAGTSFAEDTGVTLSSLMPSGQLAASGGTTVLSTAISANFSVAASQALSNYITAANTAGQTLEWGVLGAQYPGSTATSSIKTTGADLTVFDAQASAGTNIGNNYGLSTIATISSAFDSDVAYLTNNNAYKSGGTSYAFSAGSSAANVWGAGGDSGNGGSTNLYNQGPEQDNIGLNTAVTLYGITGNGDKTSVQSYILGTNLELSNTGVLSISGGTGSPPPPVPLPAAVWLFGSGLLGLIGVGRRKAAA
jgi:hypothetical protein